MSFPQLSTPAALALLLLLAAAIVALHLLRPRVARAVVGSNLLWALVLGRRTQRNPRWRWWLTVLLALAIGLGLLLAALLPTSLIAQAPAQRVLLVIDNAPSMQARMRDGRSRLAHAREAAAAWLRSQGDGVAVRVADTMGLAPLGDFVPPARACCCAARTVSA